MRSNLDDQQRNTLTKKFGHTLSLRRSLLGYLKLYIWTVKAPVTLNEKPICLINTFSGNFPAHRIHIHRFSNDEIYDIDFSQMLLSNAWMILI